MNQVCAELLATPFGWNEDCLSALSQWEESKILAPTGLTLQTYGTARYLTCNPRARRTWRLQPLIASGLNFGVEELPSNLHHLATDRGTCVADISVEECAETKLLILDACEVVATLAPLLFHSIRYLLRSLHVISSDSPQTDVSFSVPYLPNTIFGSIPNFNEKNAAARLAETIVHEVLHLQLTLVEKYCPIVRFDMETRYMNSPWRNSSRPEIGVVHGLFVFRNLEILWSQVNIAHSESLLYFAEHRVNEIRTQIASLNEKKFQTLTQFGQKVAAELFGNNLSALRYG